MRDKRSSNWSVCLRVRWIIGRCQKLIRWDFRAINRAIGSSAVDNGSDYQPLNDTQRYGMCTGGVAMFSIIVSYALYNLRNMQYSCYIVIVSYQPIITRTKSTQRENRQIVGDRIFMYRLSHSLCRLQRNMCAIAIYSRTILCHTVALRSLRSGCMDSGTSSFDCNTLRRTDQNQMCPMDCQLHCMCMCMCMISSSTPCQ